MMKIILLDIDGVLADFNTAFYRWLAAERGDHDINPPEGWGPGEWDWPEALFDKELVKKAWREIPQSETFWLGILRYMDTLRVYPFTQLTYLVTARPQTIQVQHATHEMFGYSNILPVKRPEYKALVGKALGASLLIDDRPETIAACNGVIPNLWLVDRPWNAGRAPLNCRVIAPSALAGELEEFLK